MKRFLVIFMLLFMFLLTGCNNRENESELFVVIQSASYDHPYDVVYHKDTKVMYVVSNGNHSHGNFTLLVNQDGTPMIYEAESEEK